MAQLLELRGDETRARGGHRARATRPRCCRACAREVVTIERYEIARARGRARARRARATRTWRCATGDGILGAPDRAPFDGISVTATAAGEPPAGAAATSSRPAARSCARWTAAGDERLVRFRDDGEEMVAGVRFVPARPRGRVLIREFSAGGVVVRRFRGRPFVAVVRVRDDVLALPKGHPDGNESAMDAARREVREEAGVEAEPVEKLGDVRYWYWRDGDRVLKIVSFFLFRWRSGKRPRPRSRGRGRALDSARGGTRAAAPTRASATWPPPRCPAWRPASSLPAFVFVLNFYSPVFIDQLKRGRKTATIRLGNKSKKYRKGEVVMITVGFQHSPRERIFEAVIDSVEVKKVERALAPRHRARQPGVPPARRDGPLPGADLRPQGGARTTT